MNPFRPLPSLRSVAILLLVLLGEALLLSQVARREVLGYFPIAHDQAGYLTRIYASWELAQNTSLLNVLVGQFRIPSPTGVLLVPEALFSMVFLGPGRAAPLALLFLHFAVAQVILWLSLHALTRSTAPGWLATGLLLGTASPLLPVGGLLDVRLDSLAASLFLVVLSLVLASRVFLLRPYAPWIAVSVVMLVLTRFITAVYGAGIVLLLILWFAFRRRESGALLAPSARASRNRRRARNLLLTSGLAALVAAPVLIWNARALYRYYVVGHVLSVEKTIRAKEFSVGEGWSALLYYPQSFWRDHAGSAPLLALFSVFVLLVGAVLRYARSRATRPPSRSSRATRPDGTFAYFLLVSLLAPLLVLSANASKSPVVGSILVPPLILSFVLALHRFARRWSLEAWLSWAAGATLLLGFGAFAEKAVKIRVHSTERPYAEAVNTLYREIGAAVAMRNLTQPRIAFVEFSDALIVPALEVSAFETRGRLLHANSTLGGIFALTAPEILGGLRRADLVVSPDVVRGTTYPYFDSIRAHWDQIQDYLRNETFLVGEVDLPGRGTVRLHMKDHVVVSGLSGEWITAEGLSLHVEAPRPLGDSLLFLVCDVPSFAGYSADSLSPRLLLQRSDGPPVELTVQARPAGSAVELQAKFPPAFSSVSADLALTFRPHFVPKLLGMNHDERKLCARFFDIGIRHNRNATVTASDVAAVPEGRHRPMP